MAFFAKRMPLDVRELLQLDREFYTADDPSIVNEVISQIRIAGIQVYKWPMLIIDAIQKLSLKALYLPDQRRILLDSDLPEKKHHWNEAHEIGHSLIPWHHDIMLGENELIQVPTAQTPSNSKLTFVVQVLYNQ